MYQSDSEDERDEVEKRIAEKNGAVHKGKQERSEQERKEEYLKILREQVDIKTLYGLTKLDLAHVKEHYEVLKEQKTFEIAKKVGVRKAKSLETMQQESLKFEEGEKTLVRTKKNIFKEVLNSREEIQAPPPSPVQKKENSFTKKKSFRNR